MSSAVNVNIVIDQSGVIEAIRRLQRENRKSLISVERRKRQEKKLRQAKPKPQTREGRAIRQYRAVLDEPAASRRRNLANAYVVELIADNYEVNTAENVDFVVHFEPTDQAENPIPDFTPSKGATLVDAVGTAQQLTAGGQLSNWKTSGGQFTAKGCYYDPGGEVQSGVRYSGEIFQVDTTINPSNGLYFPNNFYLEAWINTNAPDDTTFQTILSFNTRNNSRASLVLMDKGNYDWGQAGNIPPETWSNTYQLQWQTISVLYNYHSIHQTLITRNSWTHVALMRYVDTATNTSRIVTFVNGVPSISRSVTTSGTQMNGTIMNISNRGLAASPFRGKIDEVAFWANAKRYDSLSNTVLTFTPPTDPYDEYSGSAWYFWQRFEPVDVEATISGVTSNYTLSDTQPNLHNQLFFAYNVDLHEPATPPPYNGYSLNSTAKYFVLDFSRPSSLPSEPQSYRCAFSLNALIGALPDNVPAPTAPLTYSINIYPMFLDETESFDPDLDPEEEVTRLLGIAALQAGDFDIAVTSASTESDMVIYLQESPGAGDPVLET